MEENKEFSEEDFQDWLSNLNEWGDLDQDYFAYVQDFIDNEGRAEDMKTFTEYARGRYEDYLHEVHKDDALDDEDEPYPYSENSDEND